MKIYHELGEYVITVKLLTGQLAKLDDVGRKTNRSRAGVVRELIAHMKLVGTPDIDAVLPIPAGSEVA